MFLTGQLCPFAWSSVTAKTLAAGGAISCAALCAYWGSMQLVTLGVGPSAAPSIAMVIEISAWILILWSGNTLAMWED